MEMYWIVPKRCIGTNLDDVNDDYIIYFEELAKDFPVLLKLVLE